MEDSPTKSCLSQDSLTSQCLTSAEKATLRR